MSSIVLRFMKSILFTICISMLGLSAYTLQIPESAVRYPSDIGPLHVVHDDHIGWSIIDNEDREFVVETYDVDSSIRFIDNKDLEKVLGYVQYEVSCIDLETHEEISKWLVQTNGYLYVNSYDDGTYNITMKMRGPGGGPIAGMLIGGVIKCVGYGVIAACGGPVGWGVAAAGISETLVSGAIGVGTGKLAKAASKSKAAVKMAKQLKETQKAVRHYNEAAKALQTAQSIYDKAQTAKNLKRLKDAAEACQKLKQVADAKAMATAVVGAAKAGGALAEASGAVRTADKAGQLANTAVKGGMAVALPAVAIVNVVGDVGQLIGDFLPCF